MKSEHEKSNERRMIVFNPMIGDDKSIKEPHAKYKNQKELERIAHCWQHDAKL
jgi:hypothetical protein